MCVFIRVPLLTPFVSRSTEHSSIDPNGSNRFRMSGSDIFFDSMPMKSFLSVTYKKHVHMNIFNHSSTDTQCTGLNDKLHTYMYSWINTCLLCEKEDISIFRLRSFLVCSCLLEDWTREKQNEIYGHFLNYDGVITPRWWWRRLGFGIGRFARSKTHNAI